MGLINPPEVRPSIVRALYRVCLHCGVEQAATIEQYLELLAPTGVVGSADARRLDALRTIREATRLGILVPDLKRSDHFRLALAPVPAGVSSLEAECFMSRQLRQLAFSEANNSDLFGTSGKSTEEADAEQIAGETLLTTGAREFNRIQAWLYTFDPLGAAFVWAGGDKQGRRGVQQSQQADRRFVVNDFRWNAFRRWSLYLGLSRQDGRTGAGVIPDPTVAIFDELPDLRASGNEQRPLSDFRNELAVRIPVLDGGSYRTAVLAALGQQAADDELSRPLTLALARLERGGHLSLEHLADYSGHVFEFGRRLITHIRFTEPTR